MFSGFSDIVLLALIGLVTVVVNGVTMAVQEYFNSKRAAAQAAEVREVKEALVGSNRQRVIDNAELKDAARLSMRIQRATHQLVNKEKSLALLESLNDKEEIAKWSDTAENRVRVKKAALELADHLAKQAVVDAEFGEEAKHMGTDGPTKKGD